MKRIAFAVLLVGIALTSLPSAQGGNPSYKPKRINKMIELGPDGPTVKNNHWVSRSSMPRARAS